MGNIFRIIDQIFENVKYKHMFVNVSLPKTLMFSVGVKA